MVIEDQLIEPFYIKVYPDSFTLVKKNVSEGKGRNTDKKGEKGNVYETTAGFYSNIENAINRVVREQIVDESDVFTLKEYYDDYINRLTAIKEKLKLDK